jgi:hypothetical protein
MRGFPSTRKSASTIRKFSRERDGHYKKGERASRPPFFCRHGRRPGPADDMIPATAYDVAWRQSYVAVLFTIEEGISNILNCPPRCVRNVVDGVWSTARILGGPCINGFTGAGCSVPFFAACVWGAALSTSSAFGRRRRSFRLRRIQMLPGRLPPMSKSF